MQGSGVRRLPAASGWCDGARRLRGRDGGGLSGQLASLALRHARSCLSPPPCTAHRSEQIDCRLTSLRKRSRSHARWVSSSRGTAPEQARRAPAQEARARHPFLFEGGGSAEKVTVHGVGMPRKIRPLPRILRSPGPPKKSRFLTPFFHRSPNSAKPKKPLGSRKSAVSPEKPEFLDPPDLDPPELDSGTSIYTFSTR